MSHGIRIGHLVLTPDGFHRLEEHEMAASNMPVNEPMLQFFAWAHLPAHLQGVSKPFGELAQYMVDTLPRNPERSAGLRKLLEAKDCAVRAVLYKDA